jgi:uncharacterized protein YcaQ
MAFLRLTWNEVASFRLRRQHLEARAPASEMLAVTARIGGLHAQLMSSAELALWARVEGLARTAVRDALWRDRTLVKTWAMRGTLHLLPSFEYGLWQAALSNYRHWLRPGWLRAFGMTARDHQRLSAAIGEALEGKVLSRAELATAVYRRTRSARLRDWVLQSWGSMLKPAAYQGRLCFGPSSGQNVRFAGPDAWLGVREEHDPQEALREMARRFLFAHGPAAREDLRRYWHVSVAAARKLFEDCGAVPVEVEGEEMWMLPEDAKEAARARPAQSVRLLPAFDQYVIGASRHAERLMPGAFRPRVYRQQGWLSPVLLVEGRMEGIWRAERKGKSLLVRIEPFGKLPRAVTRAAALEAERLASFLGGSLQFEVG